MKKFYIDYNGYKYRVMTEGKHTPLAEAVLPEVADFYLVLIQKGYNAGIEDTKAMIRGALGVK